MVRPIGKVNVGRTLILLYRVWFGVKKFQESSGRLLGGSRGIVIWSVGTDIPLDGASEGMSTIGMTMRLIPSKDPPTSVKKARPSGVKPFSNLPLFQQF